MMKNAEAPIRHKHLAACLPRMKKRSPIFPVKNLAPEHFAFHLLFRCDNKGKWSRKPEFP